MVKIYYEKDCRPELLKNKTIAVIGYGSQGRAQACNLKDAGLKVVIGLRRQSSSRAKATGDGHRVLTIEEAVGQADVVALLLPDDQQPEVFQNCILPHLVPGRALVFAHGFNIRFGFIAPPGDLDILLVAPKSPGPMVRLQYCEGRGVPCLVAVGQDVTGTAKDLALAYAQGIGGARAGLLETTFAEETETDLFGEQAVLCGGVAALVKAGFETLVEAGYQPEVAYFECLHELKLIVDLMYQGGLSLMRDSVSDTAEFGDYASGPRIITSATRQEMGRILAEIRDGSFARKWLQENMAGRPFFQARRQAEKNQLIEKVGRTLRQMMPWIAGSAAPCLTRPEEAP